jgi:hypothetical protein
MMSLCHSWFGRDLSKKRGFAGFFTGLDLAFFVRPSPESVLCTLVALALTRKKRLSTAAMRRGPYSGWDLFTPTIRFLTASVSLGRAPGGSLGTSPSAPCCRYAFAQRCTEWLLTPNCSRSTEVL